MLISAIVIVIVVPLLLLFMVIRMAEFQVKEAALLAVLFMSIIAFILSVEYLKSYYCGDAFSRGFSKNLHIRR
jgi:hypothetical protein